VAGSEFTMAWVERTRQRYRRLGDIEGWEQEYMCRAVAEEMRAFWREYIRVMPQVRSWEGVWCMIDSARTLAHERDDGLGGMELDQGSVGGMRRGSRAAAAGCGGGSVLSFGARVTAGGDRV